MKLINFISRYQSVLFILFLLVLSLALYYPNLNAFFVSDDFEWLAVSIDRNPWDFFVTNYAGTRSGGSFGPLVNLVYYFGYQLGNLQPSPYHLFSIFFHLLNLILIYLLSKKLLGHRVAIISSLFFAVYFNNSEAVAWIAAIPHLIATSFFLLAIYTWLFYQEQKKYLFYILSLLSFILALGAKEIALSLPMVLCMLSMLQSQQSKLRYNWRQIVYYLFGYLVIIIVYLYWRYYTTGIFFGYYGRSQLGFDLKVYIENFYYLLTALVSSGDVKIYLFTIIQNYLKFLLPISLLSLASLIFVYKNKLKLLWPYLLIFFSLLLPYLSLAPNPVSNEGERYTYLPVIFIVIILAYILAKLSRKYLKLVTLLVLIVVFSSSYALHQKNKNWLAAAQISKNIIDNFGQQIDTQSAAQIYFVYLPDNLAGAQVFRNAIVEAIDLYYPQHNLILKALPIHIILNNGNQNDNLFVWEKRDKANQLLGHTINKQNLITGPLARQETDDLIFELWGYSYQTFMTDRIFLEFKDKLIKSETNKPVYFLYYNGGVLQFLNYSL